MHKGGAKCLVSTAITMEQTLESAPKVGVEHVIYDGVGHGTTVGQPLKGRDDGRCHIVATSSARASQQVGGEKGQVEHDEGGEQNADDLYGPSPALEGS